MNGLNCKTYVEGKGWLYPHEINPYKAPERTKTIDEYLFPDEKLKAQVAALRANERVVWKTKEMTWDEIREDKIRRNA